jgi:hypothetical protein
MNVPDFSFFRGTRASDPLLPTPQRSSRRRQLTRRSARLDDMRLSHSLASPLVEHRT